MEDKMQDFVWGCLSEESKARVKRLYNRNEHTMREEAIGQLFGEKNVKDSGFSGVEPSAGDCEFPWFQVGLFAMVGFLLKEKRDLENANAEKGVDK